MPKLCQKKSHPYLNIGHPLTNIKKAVFVRYVIKQHYAISFAEVRFGDASKPNGAIIWLVHCNAAKTGQVTFLPFLASSVPKLKGHVGAIDTECFNLKVDAQSRAQLRYKGVLGYAPDEGGLADRSIADEHDFECSHWCT